MSYKPSNPNGQALMASSTPVVIASNQSSLPVTGTFWQATQPVSGTVGLSTGTNTIGAVNIAASQTLATVTTVGAVTSITNALPAGTNAIGKLAANSGVDIGDVDVLSVIPGTAATNLGKVVDGVAGATDVGVLSLAVRTDTPVTLTPIVGDYTQLRVNSVGRLWASATIDAALPAGTNAIGSITNLSQLGGQAISMNTGVRDAGTQRVTIATNDSVPVTGTFWQATQPVSGPLTDAQLRTTAVAVTGPLTDTQLRASAVAVTGTFYPATQPVSGTVAATQSGTWTVQPGNTANTTPWLWRHNEGLGTATVLAAANANIAQALLGNHGAAITITAISAPTGIVLTPQVSYDGGTNYVASTFYDVNTAIAVATINTFAVGNTFSITTGDGATHVRVIVTSWTSGSVTVRLSTSNAQGLVNLRSSAVHDLSAGTFTQLVSGFASSTAPTAVGAGDAARIWTTLNGAVNIADGGGSITVDGTFWQAIQPVSGTVIATQALGTAATRYFAQLSDGTNSPAIKAASTAAVVADPALVVAISPNNSVTVTQPTASNLNATVTGTVELGATSLAALENISVTIPGTVDLGTISLTALETISVTGTFWQATQPVSIASVPSHPVTNAGTFAVQAAQSGTWTVQPGNTTNTTPWLVKPAESLGAATALGALNAEITHALGGNLGAAATITATATPVGVTLTPYASYDGGTNWTVTQFFNSVTGDVVPTLTAFTVGDAYSLSAGDGATHVKVRATGWTSGSVTVRLSSTNSQGLVNLKATAVHDDPVGSFIIQNGAYASTTAPTAVAVGDAVRLWATTSGALNIADGGGSVTVDGTFWQATQPVSLASVPSHPVTNAGTFAVQVSSALPAGTNAIGSITNTSFAATQSGTWNIGTVTTLSQLGGQAINLGAGSTAAGTLRTIEASAATGTQSNPSLSTTSATLLAANTNRRGASVFNNSAAIVYVRLSATAASTTTFTIKLQPDDYYEVPSNYNGAITAILNTGSTTAVQVTEIT